MIRKAIKKDIEGLNQLGVQVLNNFTTTYNLNDYIDNNKYIILVNEESVINGLLIVYQNIDYYELELIVVLKDDRNKHIATELLHYFENNYLNKNDAVILEVATDNEIALKLYQKFGYEVINIRKNYYNTNKDAYVMKKVIK